MFQVICEKYLVNDIAASVNFYYTVTTPPEVDEKGGVLVGIFPTLPWAFHMAFIKYFTSHNSRTAC